MPCPRLSINSLVNHDAPLQLQHYQHQEQYNYQPLKRTPSPTLSPAHHSANASSPTHTSLTTATNFGHSSPSSPALHTSTPTKSVVQQQQAQAYSTLYSPSTQYSNNTTTTSSQYYAKAEPRFYTTEHREQQQQQQQQQVAVPYNKSYAASSPSTNSTSTMKAPTTPQTVIVKTPRGKRHRCTFPGCGRDFSRLSNLKAHWRRHSGEEPYACMHCTRKFKWRSSLKSHELGCVYEFSKTIQNQQLQQQQQHQQHQQHRQQRHDSSSSLLPSISLQYNNDHINSSIPPSSSTNSNNLTHLSYPNRIL